MGGASLERLFSEVRNLNRLQCCNDATNKAERPQINNVMNTITLTPNDSRKSFYNKAKVLESVDTQDLQSYSTIVASYNKATGELTLNGYYSVTTGRHISAFLVYIGFPNMSKAEIEAKTGTPFKIN
jgi:hypothetical protein